MGQIPMNNQLHVNQAGDDTAKISSKGLDSSPQKVAQ